MSFILPQLPYAYNALEPVIDKETMEIHHTKHHQAYITNLNAALEWTPYEAWTIETLLLQRKTLPENIQTPVRNHGWWHHNHTLFRQSMRAGGWVASSEFLEKVRGAFGGLDELKNEFTKTALSHFGSWRAWLVQKPSWELAIYTLPNQDSPLMSGDTPLVGLDVWEHAYYLQYQNRRADYCAAWWNVVDWRVVEERTQ
jgi:Fe-Mn family superoxide dismutase